MKHNRLFYVKYTTACILIAATVVALCGCSETLQHRDVAPGEPNHGSAIAIESGEQKIFDLREISPQQGQAFLSELELGTTSIVTGRNAIALRGAASDLYRAGIVLDLVDTREDFLVEALAPASSARTVPSNSRIAATLGDIAIGTFANPPQHGERTRAIIDIHGRSIVAIVPARIQKELRAFVEFGADEAEASAPAKTSHSEEVLALSILPDDKEATPGIDAAPKTTAPSEKIVAASPAPAPCLPAEPNTGTPEDRSQAVIVDTPEPPVASARTKSLYDIAPLANGDDTLQLDLPDQVEITQLLDLAAEYLHIDYMYEPEKIRGQSVSLRLHGKLQGEIRVKDLYPLLESVLKFKGFAMTCHKENLVTIVPVADALDADPMLMDPNGTGLGTGDMVVTRVFHLQHIHAVNAMNLLDNMRLSVAASPIEETSTLIVTCYAHRMARIERLLEMVDRPGRLKEYRSRQLKHAMAGALTAKIKALVAELQNTPVDIASLEQASSMPGVAVRVPLTPSPPGGRRGTEGAPADSMTRHTVYLDADEGTNRILMVGNAEQLAIVDEVIDSLDVAQQDLRTFKMYEIKHVDAEETRNQLAEFALISKKDKEARPLAGVEGGVLATAPVHAETGMPADTQGLASGSATAQEPQVSVLASTNSLLVNATQVQHARIARVIEYVDTTASQEAIPYEIYFLENQDPEQLAEVFQKLLQETIVDKEAKIDQPQTLTAGPMARRMDGQTIIVPDKNTFSLIVYASRKNQEWIRKLIKTLDKRRPQVLIDATLVEIRKNDEFNYDLELAAGIPDLRVTGGQTSQFMADADTTVTERLRQSGRNHIVDFQAKSGKGIGFYADEHIQALLTAVQTKNYGRVLAKPKVLVNDNETGNIKTADTTYVVTKSSVPVAGGAAGQQNQLIETAVGYEPYEAGITLEITPHISDGDLLRLEVALTRSDFTSTSTDKPPNQTSSNVGTVVTVPDGSTIILGGMLKLNQTKGGSKVPILGDLPLVGGLFRSVDRSDVQSMLYIFVRAEIIRPAQTGSNSYEDLRRISDENREAFERHEKEFQDYETWPSVKPKPMTPGKVLDTR